MKVEVYGLPHCTTCQKALDYLESNGVEVGKFHDLKTDRLPEAKVRKLARMVGDAESLFSKRAMKYRSMKLNERDLSEDEMIELMTEEYTFIRRPVIVTNGRAISGFSVKRLEAFLNE